jgi:hypothetical protein
MTRQFQINPRTISSSFLEPLPSHLQAQLVVSRLSMPRPPRSIGHCTLSQATKQQPPLACFLPFQRNPFLNLLINLINHLGTLIATRIYTGIAESTYLTRVARRTTSPIHEGGFPTWELIRDLLNPRHQSCFAKFLV